MTEVETKEALPLSSVVLDEEEERRLKKERRLAAAETSLDVFVVGLSHHNAKVEVREKLSIQEAHWNEASAVGLSPHVSAGPVTSGDGLRHCASSRPLTAPGVSTTTG